VCAAFIAGVFGTTSMAQSAGSLISTNKMREVASGWSAKKQILGKDGKIVLPGATKDALKAAPEFEYATK
jgi:hypothetical protein